MKDKYKQISDKTNPILIGAAKLMLSYARATGINICVLDHDYIPIREVFDELTANKNSCFFCMKYKNKIDVKDSGDFYHNPCREMFINSVMEASRTGGSFSFECELGFMFWTSPIYSGGRFIGALVGSAYTGAGADKEEICSRMGRICNGEIPKAELMKSIEKLPVLDPRKIKALSELMLICSESLSSGSDDCHTAVRRRALQQAKLSASVEDLKNKIPSGDIKSEYPIEKERKLLEALRRGDVQSCRELLNELLAVLLYSDPGQFKNIQYRAIELAVLISRTDTGPGFTSVTILEANNRHLNSIQDAHNMEELTDALYRIVDDKASQIFSFQGARHASALKKAEYYILENFTRKISLKEIADVSGFSSPYFSTIFKEEMGENFSSYLNRLRVEKASYLLVHTEHSLSSITRACGFEDQSWFSKIFKAYTGISPRKYRNQGGKFTAKISEGEA